MNNISNKDREEAIDKVRKILEKPMLEYKKLLVREFDNEIDDILEEYGYAVVNHPEASRASHIRTYKQALKTLLTSEKNKARIDELNRIPVFEVKDTPGNAAQYIIDRLAQLNSLQGE